MALRHRIQMAVITRFGAGGWVGEGERIAEMTRGIAVTARVLLSHKKGDLGEVVEAIGGTLHARTWTAIVYAYMVDGAAWWKAPRY